MVYNIFKISSIYHKNIIIKFDLPPCNKYVFYMITFLHSFSLDSKLLYSFINGIFDTEYHNTGVFDVMFIKMFRKL